jgi:hypothetical protein
VPVLSFLGGLRAPESVLESACAARLIGLDVLSHVMAR